MANKTPITSGNFNTAGNICGSVSLVNVAANSSTYLTVSTTSILTPALAQAMPGFFIIRPNTANPAPFTRLEMTPDGGTTWNDLSSVSSGGLFFLDGSANFRIFNTTGSVTGLLFTPIKLW